MKCPMCDGSLNHHEEPITVPVDLNHPARPGENLHAYVCEECPFVGFEYINKYDTLQLTEYLERPTGMVLCKEEDCNNLARELIAPNGISQPVCCDDCLDAKKA